jgi:arsenate reductase
MSLVLYHNPRCSKSREALALLRERGLNPEVMLYLETPPSVAELKAVLSKLKLSPRDLLRTKEALYAELGLENTRLTDAALLKAMVDNPVLIERPILVSGKRAVIGRPPERILEIL